MQICIDFDENARQFWFFKGKIVNFRMVRELTEDGAQREEEERWKKCPCGGFYSKFCRHFLKIYLKLKLNSIKIKIKFNQN